MYKRQFQISVAGDIRFYGLLKTIGTTPRQLKRIIRQQALLLCLIGIPAGLLLGYGIGAVLMPVVLHSIPVSYTHLGWLTAPFVAEFTLLQLYQVLGYQQDSLFPYDTDS